MSDELPPLPHPADGRAAAHTLSGGGVVYQSPEPSRAPAADESSEIVPASGVPSSLLPPPPVDTDA